MATCDAARHLFAADGTAVPALLRDAISVPDRLGWEGLARAYGDEEVSLTCDDGSWYRGIVQKTVRLADYLQSITGGSTSSTSVDEADLPQQFKRC